MLALTLLAEEDEFDATTFVFSDQWWLLFLIVLVGWASSRRGR